MQVESRATAEEIEKVTDSYRVAAKRGAILFFSMAGLSTISSMYEFSLFTYLDVFTKALSTSARDPQVPQRVLNIIDTLTRCAALRAPHCGEARVYLWLVQRRVRVCLHGHLREAQAHVLAANDHDDPRRCCARRCFRCTAP